MSNAVDLSLCIQKVRDIGVTHLHNICNGTITNIPWGSTDWIMTVMFGGFFLIVMAMFARLTFEIWRRR